MNIVVDASVAAKWLLVEEDSDKAEALFRAWTAKRIGLLAPEILPAEVASALWKRVMRGLLPAAEALKLQREFNDLAIPLHPRRESWWTRSPLGSRDFDTRSTTDCILP